MSDEQLQRSLQGLIVDSEDMRVKLVSQLLKKRAELEHKSPYETIECIECCGSSPEECGCQGTCTVDFALTYIDGELEHLCQGD